MITKIKTIILDAVFPHICFCGKWGEALCEDCYSKILKNKRELCPICQALSENGKTCKSCRSRSYLTGVMVFGKHESLLKDVIWRYKYEFIRDLSIPLLKLLHEKYHNFLNEKQFLITNVPISQSRMKWRGFNQAELIARELGLSSNLDYKDLLLKEEAEPQVGLKRKERIQNIKGKIKLIDIQTSLENKKILIIDDVYTSGSTLEECAKVLRQAGAREVWGMVISRE